MFEGDPPDDLRDAGAGAAQGRQQERLAEHVGEVDVHIHLGFAGIDALLGSHGCGRRRRVPGLMRGRGGEGGFLSGRSDALRGAGGEVTGIASG